MRVAARLSHRLSSLCSRSCAFLFFFFFFLPLAKKDISRAGPGEFPGSPGAVNQRQDNDVACKVSADGFIRRGPSEVTLCLYFWLFFLLVVQTWASHLIQQTLWSPPCSEHEMNSCLVRLRIKCSSVCMRISITPGGFLVLCQRWPLGTVSSHHRQ